MGRQQLKDIKTIIIVKHCVGLGATDLKNSKLALDNRNTRHVLYRKQGLTICTYLPLKT